MAKDFQSSRRIFTLVGLVLALGLLAARGNEAGQRYLGMTALESRDLFWWPLLVVMLLYVVLVERRPLASIGLHRPDWKTLVVGVAGAAAMIGMFHLLDPIQAYFHIQPESPNAPGKAIYSAPYWYRVLLVSRASLAEEVVFRGYTQERIEELTGSRLLAGVVSVAAFVFAHLAFFGWGSALGIGLAGIIFTVMYQWRRDLWANILTHFIVDAVDLLL